MIVGSAGTARAVAFPAGMGAEELSAVVGAALDELRAQPAGEAGVVILTDLPGGTPARVAATIAATTVAAPDHGPPGSEVAAVTGVNLPMAAELLLADPGRSAGDLAALAYDSGRRGVIDIGALLHDKEASP